MDSKELMVRSNIVLGLETHMRVEKEKEEKEKEERELRWKREADARVEAENAFKIAHPNVSAYTYVSHYNFSSYTGEYSARCKIFFYEWSNLLATPRKFDYVGKFYLFLDECRLFLKFDQNNKMKSYEECHIICLPNSHEMVLAPTYYDLCKEYKLAVNKAEVMKVYSD